jgi:putative oxidoreductase
MASSSKGWWAELDARMVRFMDRHGIRLLRISLGVVFIWFGLLKLSGRSPVVDLVVHAVPWAPPDVLIPALGAWETTVGIGLLFRFALRFTLLLFWLLLAGTLTVFLMAPHVAFQDGRPWLLTMEGEFIVKNLVLISGGLVVGSTVPGPQSKGSRKL